MLRWVILILGIIALVLTFVLGLARRLPPTTPPYVVYQGQHPSGMLGIFRVGIDGGRSRPLTPPNLNGFDSQVTPQGDIVFVARAGADTDIFQVNLVGNRLINLTDDARQDQRPAFSADGRWLVYRSFMGEAAAIYRLPMAGGRPLYLAPSGRNATPPLITPDGQWVIFASNHEGINTKLYRVGMDGTDLEVLSTLPVNGSPMLTPDGRWVLFMSEQYGTTHIYRVDINGEHLLNVTQHTANDYLRAITPDSQAVIFWSDRARDAEIYRINLDGSGLVNLSHHPAQDRSAVLSADGRYLFIERLDERGLAELYRLDLATNTTQFWAEGHLIYQAAQGRYIFYRLGNLGQELYLSAVDEPTPSHLVTDRFYIGSGVAAILVPPLSSPWHTGKMVIGSLILLGLSGGWFVIHAKKSP